MGHPTGPKPREREWVGLPARVFLYTPDQIAVIIGVDTQAVKNYLWYQGRELGAFVKHKLRAVNIAEPHQRPEWRVAEQELIRWMRVKGFRYFDRGWVE